MTRHQYGRQISAVDHCLSQTELGIRRRHLNSRLHNVDHETIIGRDKPESKAACRKLSLSPVPVRAIGYDYFTAALNCDRSALTAQASVHQARKL
jgi:hypothetical protein